MPPKPRKLIMVSSGTALLGAIICAFFDWHGTPHSRIWGHLFYGLLLLNQLFILLMMKRHPSNAPVPNPLIGLFPNPQPPQKDDKQ